MEVSLAVLFLIIGAIAGGLSVNAWKADTAGPGLDVHSGPEDLERRARRCQQ